MKWKPVAYNGPFEQLVAFFAAISAGIVLPYMGHRRIEAGGKAALECVIKSALAVAAVFIISDYDGLKRFLVVGSQVSS